MARDKTTLDLQTYFRSKTKQLRAAFEEVITAHGTLQGSHRELVMQEYLRDLLPRRFEAGKGMVYGAMGRSNEADIVLWDSQNYPKIPMKGHNAFFAESVKAVVEVKSSWSDKNLADIKDQCNKLRNLIRMWEPDLVERLILVEQQVQALASDEELPGVLLSRPHIATIGMIFLGGQTVADYLTPPVLEVADDEWPDLLLLLEPGIVVVKNYEPLGPLQARGYIEIVDAGEDALLYFTAALTALLTDRTRHVEDSWYMAKYAWREFDRMPRRPELEFPVLRPASGFSAP